MWNVFCKARGYLLNFNFKKILIAVGEKTQKYNKGNVIYGLNTFNHSLPKILLISFQKNACFRGNIKGNRKSDLYIQYYRKLPYSFLSNWRCYQLIVINSFIYFFWKKRPCLLKISLTRILYFTSNITYSIIEEEINLSNPFAQQQN